MVCCCRNTQFVRPQTFKAALPPYHYHALHRPQNPRAHLREHHLPSVHQIWSVTMLVEVFRILIDCSIQKLCRIPVGFNYSFLLSRFFIYYVPQPILGDIVFALYLGFVYLCFYWYTSNFAIGQNF